MVLSPTSYTSKFCSIHHNEVWVKGFFFIVPHEEYGIYISPFNDEIIRETYYLHSQWNPLLHFDDTHIHGCTYDVHLSHLEAHDFSCSLPNPFDVGGTSSHTWVKIYMNSILILWHHKKQTFHPYFIRMNDAKYGSLGCRRKNQPYPNDHKVQNFHHVKDP